MSYELVDGEGLLDSQVQYNISSNEPHWGVSDFHFIVGYNHQGEGTDWSYIIFFSKISWELVIVSNLEKACKKEIDRTIVLKNLQNFVV